MPEAVVSVVSAGALPAILPPAMKIHQLPMGARFEYEGEEYTKTGPQLATGNSGQRLIPRYAVLKPIDEIAAPRAAPARSLSRQEVLATLERFLAACAALVPEERRSELEAARADFLKALD
jgi:hypothetical protein